MRRWRNCAHTAVFLLASGCGAEFEGPEVVVANHSDQTLNNVMLLGSGFTTSIGRIRPRSVESTIVHPIGESSIRVTFDVNGKPVDSGECCKFTNNSRYSIAVNIDRELQVVILANLEGQ
jgi:hypothetical protein